MTDSAAAGISFPRPRRSAPGHRARRRPRAGPELARHAHRVRRQPHVDARRARRARLRHRSDGSDARPRDAVAVAAPAEDDADYGRWPPRPTAFAPRTSSSRSLRGSALRAPRATSSNMRARRSRALSMEGRLTVCNMSIEAGARAGMIAPDDTTFEYLAGRPYAPAGREWESALARWRALPSDPGAAFDREVALDAGDIEPMVTWGTSPEDAVPITGCVPDPADAPSAERRDAIARALDYMGLQPGTPPDRYPRRSRVHRLVHQRTHRGPAQRGGGRRGPQGRRRRRGLGGCRARGS